MLRDDSLGGEISFVTDLIVTARLALKSAADVDFNDALSIAEVLGLATEILYDVEPMVTKLEARP